MVLKSVTIRPHLVPFLVKELQGSSASYDNKTAFSIPICTFSSLGKLLHNQTSNNQKAGKFIKYVFYLIIDKNKIDSYSGTIYISIDKTKELLMLCKNQIEEINSLLEDIFRISFGYYIQGVLDFGKVDLTKAIFKFMQKYDLENVGYSVEQLRRLHYRQINTNQLLVRLQKQSSNRVVNVAM